MLTLLALLATSAEAASRPDLTVAFTPPTVEVYQSARYTLTVSNSGTADAAGATLTVDLPRTATSPTVHVMGQLGARDTRCALSGTRLTCALGKVAKRASTTVWFDLAVPYSTGALVVSARAATTSVEASTTNNTVSRTLAPATIPVEVVPAQAAHARHCTGQALTSFHECALYPSSISGFDAVLEDDGSVTLVGAPANYTGSWAQTAPDALTLVLLEDGVPYAELDARGVDGDCFEGPMAFEDSTWIAMYEVCLD